ncbi:hypothetical protein N510_000654 [Firmicutes bacterium ASF500]|nr:hypothetical protein N510_000654 [Firmicutes bacterium ASF500]
MENKYDRLLDKDHFNPGGSHEKIVALIRPGSKVLECGCATGYMTRYMRDELGCNVSIVEYDHSAFQIARQYADDGICADLMGTKWLEYYKGKQFDYILFADVLEHLYDPKTVLQKVAALLCEDGYVLASIPNVAHGDILINLWDGRWNYTDVGLLDQTHIRFFAGNNLKDFWEKTGFSMVHLDYTFIELGATEASDVLPGMTAELIDALDKRGDSRIYQFIVAAQSSEYVQRNHIPFTCVSLPVNQWRAQLFLEKDGAFSADGAMEAPYFLNDFSYRFYLERPQTGHLRFDPLDRPCIVFSAWAFSDAGKLTISPINGQRVDSVDIFMTNDPQYQIDTAGKSVSWVDIRARIIQTAHLGSLQPAVERLIGQVQETQAHLEQATSALENIVEKKAQAEQEAAYANERLAQAEQESALTRERMDRAEEVVALTNRQLDQMKKEIVLANEKLTCAEEEAVLTNRRLAQAKEEIALANEKLAQAEERSALLQEELKKSEFEKAKCQQTLADREQLLNGIVNSFSFKITRPLYNLKTAIYFAMEKTAFLRRIRKAISVLRHHGLCELVRQYKEYRCGKKFLKTTTRERDATPPAMYEGEYQAKRTFEGCSTDVKALAFYLPQFHTFPENDAWWGKGFTEWTNVKKGMPRFQDHYQPRTPHQDMGYYCLEDINVMRQQAELAKSHGIYGFCFYYYWFSGKRLMEKPVDILLKHPEIDIPFCLCWANENWTRRWDGQEQDILIKQEYSDQDDETFISDLKKYLDDPRYIRVHGKPVIVVYSPCFIPDCRKSFQKWRKVARKIGVGEIEIWICLTWGRTADSMQIVDCVDAEVEFPPHNLGGEWLEIPNVQREGSDTIIYDYTRAVDYITDVWEHTPSLSLPVHYGCMLAWDNAARRKDGWHAFYHFSLKSFYHWLSEAVRQVRTRLPEEERFIFINAWNEWGEGTYLEPDQRYGYASINTAAKALFDLPFEMDTHLVDETSPAIEKDAFQHGSNVPRIAVQAHVFHVDLLTSMVEQLNCIPYSFDLFVTTDTTKKKSAIEKILRGSCTCQKFEIQVLPNQGRDIAPFMVQMASEIDHYNYIGHIHTKRTANTDYGDSWREYLFHNLLGSPEYVKRLFCQFEKDEKLGLIMPELYPPIREQAKWTGEYAGVRALLDRINFRGTLPQEMVFPAGSMFWARTDAVRPLFELKLQQTDFPEESGQRYGTLAHHVERAWVYVAEKAGYGYCTVLNCCSAVDVQMNRPADT